MRERIHRFAAKRAARPALLCLVLAFGWVIASAEDWNFVARINQGLSEIVPDDAHVEKVSGNFGFLEGPVWVRKGGYLLFSDIPANVIYKFTRPTEKRPSQFPTAAFPERIPRMSACR